MGGVKEALKPKTEEAKGLFGRFKSKKLAGISQDDFSDLISRADKVVSNLISVKESELKNEKGQELNNARKLAKLESMAYHLNQIVEIGSEYQES